MKNRKKIRAVWCCLLLAFSLAACGNTDEGAAHGENGMGGSTDGSSQVQTADSVDDVPEYSGEPYVEINDNQPEFEEYELTTVPFEEYSELDELGRCGEAEACVGEEDYADRRPGEHQQRGAHRLGKMRSTTLWTADMCTTAAI